MTDFTNISSRAILVGLRVSFWSARKLDKRVTKQAADANDAKVEAGRYNKNLLAGSKSHVELMKHVHLSRAVHYEQTLPWADEGWRLLPIENYMAYGDIMRARRSDFERLLDEFVDEYPTLKKRAHETLGQMFIAKEFPTEKNVRDRFSWKVDLKPVPMTGDIRVDLPAEEIALIEQSVRESVETAARDAMKDAWARLSEAVGRVKKASAKGGRVHDSLIEHVTATCDILSRLNLSKDESLERLRKRVLEELGNVAPSDLRDDATVRAATAKKAAAIAKAMGSFYTPSADEASAAA